MLIRNLAMCVGSEISRAVHEPPGERGRFYPPAIRGTTSWQGFVKLCGCERISVSFLMRTRMDVAIHGVAIRETCEEMQVVWARATY